MVLPEPAPAPLNARPSEDVMLKMAAPATVTASIVEPFVAETTAGAPPVTTAWPRYASTAPVTWLTATEAPAAILMPTLCELRPSAIAAPPPSAWMLERSVAFRLTGPVACTVPLRTNARVAPPTEFSDTDAATLKVRPRPDPVAAADGKGPAAATVTANTEPVRSASRRTAPAARVWAPATNDSVVAIRVFWLTEPARATAIRFFAARLREPVTARMRVSLALSRASPPCPRVMVPVSMM